MVYVIGKEYQMTYDFTGIQSSFYPYVNLGIIMLLAACGFSYIGFSVIEKEVNRGPVYKILFALLQIMSFAIVIEFYTLKVFQYPAFVQVIGFIIVITLAILAGRKSGESSSY